MTGSQGKKEETTLTEKDKTILTGRIYPAITACVGNRGKIILSVFAYYSFILNAKDLRQSVIDPKSISLYVSVVFTLFIAHNWWNYFLNAKDQIEREEGKLDCKSVFRASRMETFFAVVSFLLVWGAYCLVGSR